MARLALGRTLRLRKGAALVETLDSVRFDHLLAFARGTGKSWPTIEQLASHQDGSVELDTTGLVDELQRLAQERPSENLAPMVGLLRNDAVRVARMAARMAG